MKLIYFARVCITRKHQQISATFLDIVNHISNFFVGEVFTDHFFVVLGCLICTIIRDIGTAPIRKFWKFSGIAIPTFECSLHVHDSLNVCVC